MEPLKLGMVGCGGISHAHGPVVAKHPDEVRFVACCDVVAERAKEWARQYGCERSYTDYEKMVRKEELDAVVLATWPNQHREQIELCLNAGAKNILSEKALAMTGREAVEIFDLAEKAGAFVMEGFMYRHHPAIRRMRDLIAAGEIGEVDSVRACFNSFDPETAAGDDPDRNWREKKECGGGVPYDFACYCINACRLFAAGVPESVVCCGSVSERYDVVNRMFGVVQYDNGRYGVVESTKKGAFNQEIQVSGSKAILVLPVGWTLISETTISRRQAFGWADVRADTHHVPEANAFEPQMLNFAAAVRGAARPELPLAESVVNVFTIEGMVTSLLERREVRLDIPERFRARVREQEEKR